MIFLKKIFRKILIGTFIRYAFEDTVSNESVNYYYDILKYPYMSTSAKSLFRVYIDKSEFEEMERLRMEIMSSSGIDIVNMDLFEQWKKLSHNMS